MQTTEQQVCPSCGNYTTLIDGECALCKQRKGTIELIEQFQEDMKPVENAFDFILNYENTLDYYNKKIKQARGNRDFLQVAFILGIIVTCVLMLGTFLNLGLIVLAIFGLIGTVIFYSSFRKTNKNIDEAQDKINECNNSNQYALTDISNCYNNSNKFIPIKYSAPLLVNEIKQILVNRRANSIQEALNIYETDLYQNKMLSAQANQQAQMALIAGLSAISATANVVTAFNTRR